MPGSDRSECCSATSQRESDYRTAVAVLGAIASPRGDFRVGLALGEARRDLGAALARQGHPGEAEQMYRTAIVDGHDLVRVHGDDPNLSFLLGTARRNLADILAWSNALPRPKTSIARPSQSLVPLPRPAHTLGATLAGALSSYALLLERVGRHQDSEAQYRAAIATASETARSFPEEFAAKVQLADIEEIFAAELDELGRGDEAEKLHLDSLAESRDTCPSQPRRPRLHLSASQEPGPVGRLLSVEEPLSGK